MKFFGQLSDCQLMAKTSPLHSCSVNNIKQEKLDISETWQNTIPKINLKLRSYQETIHFSNCIPEEHNVYIHSLTVYEHFCVISDFRREVEKNCVFPWYCAAIVELL
jgi:hypothetical protein